MVLDLVLLLLLLILLLILQRGLLLDVLLRLLLLVLVVLLGMNLLRLSRHMHAFFLGLISLSDGANASTGSQSNFSVLLNEGAAQTAVAGAAVAAAAALDTVLFADFGSFHHVVPFLV